MRMTSAGVNARQVIVIGLATALVAGCGSRDTVRPPRASGAAGTATAAAAPSGTLPTGTEIRAEIVDGVSSLVAKRGDLVAAVVTGDVTAPDGRVAIPSGSRLSLRVSQMEMVASGRKSVSRIRLDAAGVQVRGVTIPIVGTLDSLPYLVRGQNIIIERATRVLIRLRSPLTVRN